MRTRLAFKIMTSVLTFDIKYKKPSYWSRELYKRYPEKQDARVSIAKRKVNKFYKRNRT